MSERCAECGEPLADPPLQGCLRYADHVPVREQHLAALLAFVPEDVRGRVIRIAARLQWGHNDTCAAVMDANEGFAAAQQRIAAALGMPSPHKRSAEEIVVRAQALVPHKAACGYCLLQNGLVFVSNRCPVHFRDDPLV